MLDGAEATRNAVARLVAIHDPAWDLAAQPEDFVAGMLRGIVRSRCRSSAWRGS